MNTKVRANVKFAPYFDKDRAVSINSVTDGTSNTLMIAEATTGVPWTKPEDLTFTGSSPLTKLGGQFKEGFVGVTADGFPRFFKKTIDPTLLVDMITRYLRGDQP